eukprot:2606032-Ditylum_brightwellii.AAC.1
MIILRERIGTANTYSSKPQSKRAKMQQPPTAAARLQSVPLITRVASELKNHTGIDDGKFSKCVINLAEQQLKAFLKKGGVHLNLTTWPLIY